MFQFKGAVILLLGLSLAMMIATHSRIVEGQSSILDQILRGNAGYADQGSAVGQPSVGSDTPGSRIGSMLNKVMSVNVPVFYDMVKNGTSLGINVLSGLVKVERGDEAARSGLQGRRPLSVRVFGVPVYERGTRVRPLAAPSGPAPPSAGLPPAVDDAEELPIEP